jgi:hypothetical protein
MRGSLLCSYEVGSDEQIGANWSLTGAQDYHIILKRTLKYKVIQSTL